MGHFYHPKTGELIDGNLRDARRVNGLPSPTTVLGILSSPGLLHYFKRQIFEATATTTRDPNWTDDEYYAAVTKYADEHGQSARDKGGDFHSMVQNFHELSLEFGAQSKVITNLTRDPNLPMADQFNAYCDWYRTNVRRSLMVEQAVVGQGYAGRVDHVAEMMDGRIACLDAKTQDTTKKKGKFVFYDQWPVQLGAYAGAIKPLPDCLISVAVSSNLPAVVEAKIWEGRGWEGPVEYYHKLFLGLLEYWKHSNDYHPI